MVGGGVAARENTLKATIIGLVVSTAAFGATTVYFWQQFSEASVQAEEVAEANRRLNARVAELEQIREQFMSRRSGGDHPFNAGVIAHHPTGAVAAVSSESVNKEGVPTRDGAAFATTNRAPMPPSMIKTLRNQMRAQNAKTYFDLKSRLGLSQEDADKLLDLITEQQTASFNQPREVTDSNNQEAMRNDWQRIDGQINDLLGSAKAAEYGDYKKEMPARMEVAMLAQQFDSSEAPLNDQQRARLVTALSEERDSVPMPSFSNATKPEQYTQEYEAWQADYEHRVTERARTILSSAQLTVYDEYQQFQKDMRAQMAAQGRTMPRPGMMLGGPSVRMRAAAPPADSPPRTN